MPSKLASQMVEDDWAAQRKIMPIVTELTVLTGEAAAGGEEMDSGTESVVTVDWNTVDINASTDLVIAPIFDIQMAKLFGIAVDERYNEKESDGAAVDGDSHSRNDDEDIDPLLMENAAIDVDDAHPDELVDTFDPDYRIADSSLLLPLKTKVYRILGSTRYGVMSLRTRHLLGRKALVLPDQFSVFSLVLSMDGNRPRAEVSPAA